ncbi:MAG: Lipid export ATP-binding/permease protein MsbA [Myxococcaceae bacterium]|nr:Lipid export ATP-binding/permease protein MsbA [Myxococcaceae bacterium]
MSGNVSGPTKQTKPASRAERLLAQFHEETPVNSQAVDWQMLRDLLPYAKQHKPLFVIAFCLMPIGALCASLQPLLLQRAINATGLGAQASVLGSVVALYALLVVVRFTASFAETYAMQLAGQRTMADLRMAVFAHIQRLSIRHFDRTPVGRIVTRVTNDIDSMGELFASGAVTAVGDLLLLTGIVISMLWLDAELSLVAFAVLPPLFVVVEFFRRKLRMAQRLIRSRTAQLNAFLNEQVQGIQVVQAFSRERECSEAYAEINREYREANRLSIRTDALMFSAVDMLATLAVGLVLWYAARRLHLLGDEATAERQKGTFVAFYAYIQQFFVPVRDLSTKYTMIQSAFASAERVFGLLSVRDYDAPALPVTNSEPSPVPAALDLPDAPAVAFQDVVFRYKPSGPPVLAGVSFTVERGETVAIVGATGAGKTTVTGLVQRFYDVDSGTVRVGGRDVRSFEREALRSRFAVVQQDVFLFAGDLLSNIALGAATPDRARAEAALTRVSATHLFGSRGGLDMRIAERGQNLSAGERQLVSFARALYRDPELLILDEATANIDSETEARLQHAVDELLEGRTAIVIAHRLSTIRRVDRILVFHHGQIVEHGTHAELLAARGVYARLYQLQFAEHVEAAVAS